MSSIDLCRIIYDQKDKDLKDISPQKLLTIKEFNRTHSMMLVFCLLENNPEKLKREMKEDHRTRNLIKKIYNSIEEQYYMELGFFSGVHFITNLLINEKEKQIKDNELINYYCSTRKYTHDIFLYLYQHPSSRHKELAQALSLSASGLNGILKDLINDHIIEKNEQSKYSYYSLSEVAYNYTKDKLIKSENKHSYQFDGFARKHKKYGGQYSEKSFVINIDLKERENDE